jgi:glycolate oxidase
MKRRSDETGLRVANVFHAGDGNLHPMVLYNGAIEGEEERALEFSYEILRMCVDAGGSITGEHGVGREKQCEMSYMYAQPDLDTMNRVRHAFDPDNIANPEKLFPTPRLCGERRHGAYKPHPIEAAGIAEVF